MMHQFRLATLAFGALLCTGAFAADQDQAPKAATHMQQVRDALAALGAKPADATPVEPRPQSTQPDDSDHQVMNR